MASTTPQLQIDLKFCRSQIGDQLGYGRNYDGMSDSQKADVDAAVDVGTRWYLYPAVPGAAEPTIHQWSWLNRTVNGFGDDGATAIEAGTGDYLLPVDYGSLVGNIALTSSGDGEGLIAQRNAEEIFSLRAAGNVPDGIPKYFATRAVPPVSNVTGSRWELLFFPTPDKVYTAAYRYNIVPPPIVDPDQVPLGGTMHAEAWLYACKAAAERLKDDKKDVYWEGFQERLVVSIGLDSISGEGNADVPYESTEPTDTLDVTFRDLVREVGGKMYGSWDPDSWQVGQRQNAEYTVQMGYRQFLQAHPWKFLEIEQKTRIDQGQSRAYLSDRFSGQLDHLNFVGAPGTQIETVPAQRIQALLANNPTVSGAPKYAAVTLTDQDKWALLVYPRADVAYTMEFRARLIPPKLENPDDKPIGQAFHHQTILNSCMAVAEIKSPSDARDWGTLYKESLESSRQFDSENKSASQNDSWPLANVSRDIQLTWFDFMSRVSAKRKWGSDYTALSHDKNEECRFMVMRGYRRVLFPVPEEPRKVAHEWRYLAPVRSITAFPQIRLAWPMADFRIVQVAVYNSFIDQTEIFVPESITDNSFVGDTFLARGAGTDAQGVIVDIELQPSGGTTIRIPGDITPIVPGSQWGIVPADRWVAEVSQVSGQEYQITATGVPVGVNTGPFIPGMFDVEFDLGYDEKFVVKEVVSTTVLKFDVPTTITMLETVSTFEMRHLNNYPLPRDVNGINGDMTFMQQQTGYTNVRVTSEQNIRSQRQNLGETTGFPRIAAILPLASDHSDQQRFELMIWPAPDSNYDLEYRHPIIPPTLDENNPVPYGGPAHAELILESCLGVAEEEATGREGMHTARFKDMLRAAIAQDGHANEPEYYGYNSDRSDLKYGEDQYRNDRNWWRNNVVTVQGDFPSGA